MASPTKELVGLGAFANDGTKLGKVKGVITDPQTSTEYLLIGGFLAPDLVVPMSVAERSGPRVELPFAASYLDMAPKLKSKGTVSPEDGAKLAEFYHSRAA